jgi:hypothetical protein
MSTPNNRPRPTVPPRVLPRLRSAFPLLILGAILPGCVERTISITSDPPGALVTLNDVELGRTPVETAFTFFGTYDIRLRLEGYEPIATSREASAPIYEYPGPDLIAEAIPVKIHSRIAWHFDLQPLAYQRPDADRNVLDRALIERATELREKSEADKQAKPAAPPAPSSEDENPGG